MHLPHWCIYFQILYNTMDFFEWKLNLTWCLKWTNCKIVTEHTYWSVDVLLTHHIKFRVMIAFLNKSWRVWVRASVIARHWLTGLMNERSTKRGLNVTDPSIIPMISIFLSYHEKPHDKEFSHKNSKPLHELWITNC